MQLEAEGEDAEQRGLEGRAVDLGRREALELAEEALGVEAEAAARPGAPRAAHPLVGGGLRDPLLGEVPHGGGRVDVQALHLAAVDDEADTVDRDRGLGDVGAHHDLPDPLGRDVEDAVLLLHGQLRVQGQPDPLLAPGPELRDRADERLDLEGAGHEDEHVAALLRVRRLLDLPQDVLYYTILYYTILYNTYTYIYSYTVICYNTILCYKDVQVGLAVEGRAPLGPNSNNSSKRNSTIVIQQHTTYYYYYYYYYYYHYYHSYY